MAQGHVVGMARDSIRPEGNHNVRLQFSNELNDLECAGFPTVAGKLLIQTFKE